MENVVSIVALALFPLATLLGIRRLGPPGGVRAALLGGWLFLPNYGGVVDVPFLHSKAGFVPSVVLLISLLTDSHRWSRLRPNSIDFIWALFCIAPFATALSNDMSAYEGASALVDVLAVWGASYLLGRIYLGEPRELRTFAVWLVGAGLVYVPFCLWEIRMSPQLHYQVYGYSVGSFLQTIRFGGYRPTVFMAHGLMVGMFMAMGTLVAYWLWRTRTVGFVWRIPLGWCVVALALATVAVKSTGAIVLLAVGVAVLEGTRALGRPWLVVLLAIVPLTFCSARLSGWNGRDLLLGAERFGSDRAESVLFRVINEDALIAKALQRPWLGWGRWGRSRVFDESGKDIIVTDSLWIISFGTGGLLSLLTLGTLLLSPALVLLRSYSARRWSDPGIASAAVFATVLLLWAIDCLLNSLVSPIFPTLAGGIVSFVATGRAVLVARSASRRQRRPLGVVAPAGSGAEAANPR